MMVRDERANWRELGLFVRRSPVVPLTHIPPLPTHTHATVFEVTETDGGKVTDERKLDDIRRVRFVMFFVFLLARAFSLPAITPTPDPSLPPPIQMLDVEVDAGGDVAVNSGELGGRQGGGDTIQAPWHASRGLFSRARKLTPPTPLQTKPTTPAASSPPSSSSPAPTARGCWLMSLPCWRHVGATCALQLCGHTPPAWPPSCL